MRTRRQVCLPPFAGRFIQTAKEVLGEGFRPRVVQAFAQRLRQFIHMAGERDVQVTAVLAEHDGSPRVWVARIILRFAHFEEGIRIKFVDSFLQWSH
jgi:primosomal protein N'